MRNRRLGLIVALTVIGVGSAAGTAQADVHYEDHFRVTGKITMTSSYTRSSEQRVCGYLNRRLAATAPG